MGATNHPLTNRLMGPTQMLLMLILPLLAFAQEPSNSTETGDLSSGTSIELTWERIVSGFILLFIGLILTFRGYRHFRFTMFLAGFIAGVVIVYSIFTNISSNETWNYRQVIYVFGCMAGGLIGGMITAIGGRFMFWLLGGVAGLVVALYILAWRSGGLIHSKGGRVGLLAGASALGMIIGLVMGRIILIPASVIIGAYMSIVGVDLLARTGFSESINKFLTDDDASSYELTSNIYIMLGCIGGLMVLGLIAQTMSWKHRRAALAAQGRSRHDYENDWTPLGPKHHAVRPDPTYSSGQYGQDYNTGYGAGNTGTGVEYSEKHSKWNPFKKSKTTTTTTAAPITVAPTTAATNVTAPSTTAYNTTGPNAAAYNSTVDPNAATYQVADPNAATYQVADPNVVTYQAVDPNGTTYQMVDPNATAYNTATPATDAAYTTDYSDSRISYSSNAALNQNQH
ncbi:hypothetical protein EDD21DRAFT_400990 [Dissophora ornata]|nr:hypothetical protein BGZ58_011112 [Dissophora ornata]KAI8605773.1 hypothetical protein EDD21DRAFT_400990 [Dissophora ornata]